MMNKTNATAREFDPSPALIKRARRQMARYHFNIEPDGDGGFVGSATELPGVLADGSTLDECARNLAFALETAIASYLADGQSPPSPTQAEKRTEQVNVRFTPSEQARLKRKSAAEGFRGVGDMIRAEMMRAARG